MKNILKQIVVTLLRLEAKLILRKHKPKIAAVSGTVGKTSTKDAIALVFGKEFNVRKSEKSYNSELGVPLTIIGAKSAWNNFFQWILILVKGAGVFLPARGWRAFGAKKHGPASSAGGYPEWLVLEMGVDRPKDMKRLASWIKPDVAVITALGEIPSHVEYFKTSDELAKEKSRLVQNLKEENTAVLNGDDQRVLGMKEKIKAKVIVYGFSADNDLMASNYLVTPDGISFKVEYKGNIVPVRLHNIFGRHHVYTALAALAAGISQGMNLIEMAETLSLFKPPPGRLNLIEGIKNSFILDDTYNASPMAMEAALEVLNDLPAKRKIVVLGDMLELGAFTIDEHRKLGRMVKKSGAKLLFAIGPRAKFIASEARAAGFKPENIFEFSFSDEAKKDVQEKIKEGDLILIKGSQSMRMEKITEEIMLHPELKEQLLVRQEKEWQNR